MTKISTRGRAGRAVTRTVSVVGAALLAVTSPGPAQAMSGGRPVTDDGTAPWVATLAMKGDGPLLQRAGCGGALIAPDRVLTAAHCVDHTDPSQTEVHVDARVLSGRPGQVRAVRGISTLAGYQLLPSPAGPGDPNLSSAKNDLAIVLLDRPVSGVTPLRIATRRPEPGTAVAMFAHGLTAAGAGQRNDVLHRGDLTVQSPASCTAATPATVEQRSVACAQDEHGGGVTACFLDSGSPVVSFRAGVPRLAGIFSFGGETAGKRCGQAAPAYFADVTAFRRWIRQPLPPLQPYPAGRPEVAGGAVVGATVRCVAPPWDPRRGATPSALSYLWSTIERQGPYLIPRPVAGATAAQLTLAPTMAGREVACHLVAAAPGGTTLASSAPVAVTGAP